MAGLNIGVSTLHDTTERLCRDYLYTDAKQPDISVATNQADIDRERELDEFGDFSDPYYETLAVYRKIAEELPLRRRLLVHGSAIAIGDEAWIFMAESGTGKSTHTRWWRSEFAAERPFMVNDDKPILFLDEDSAYVYGTPWDGKERLSSNVRVRLTAIGLLERSEVDYAEPLPSSEGIPSIMPHVYRPRGRGAMLATIDLVKRLSNQVGLFKAGVTDSGHAAHVTRGTMAI